MPPSDADGEEREAVEIAVRPEGGYVVVHCGDWSLGLTPTDALDVAKMIVKASAYARLQQEAATLSPQGGMN